jgi:hypothetical protein
MSLRVVPYARERGYGYYNAPLVAPPDQQLELNRLWIREQRRLRVPVVDIGPDLTRRIQTGYISPFYEMEHQELAGYDLLTEDLQP